MVATRSRKPKCLVTGGAGFLGKHLVDALVDSYDVSIFDIKESGDSRVRQIVGDIRELQDVVDAVAGMDVVFHCATMAPSAEHTAAKKLAYAVNVLGTQHVIAACVQQKVPKLVYTSSASVVFEGRDLNNVDESAPYATKPLDYYTETKIEGEKVVLAANGKQGLATVALRPSGIFGEWDPLLVPTAVAKAKEGKTKWIIGNGRNMMEFTYAGNVAHAHLLAAEKLSLASPIAGRAYFVTNDDPVPFWGFLGDFLEPLGYERPRIRLPWQLLFLLAAVYELLIIPLLSPFVKLKVSEFSRVRIRIVSSNRTISCEAAKRDLGYSPQVTMAEGLKRLVAHFQPLRAGQDPRKDS